ncbi:MAG: DUF692 family multinuclear iron-containing protein [Achromobacter sp.]|uniref:multinuclear nonheme iron-dependent oxidase n=1 Tax=Achromobacter sp. TaxID=134375 RepID=UPI003D026833
MRVACSYNPNFITSNDFIEHDVELMEVGLTAYRRVFSREREFISTYRNDLSVHISRSPITEKRSLQEVFINEKLSTLKSDNRVISIGFHLCGERHNNIGKLGFSSHYTATAATERRAIEFIDLARRESGKRIWIENANFYSNDADDIFKTWKSIARITEESDANLIIDISHLIIDSHNVRLPAEASIGLIPWDKVVEVHLSGIIIGKDGSMHDSHGTPVHAQTWHLLSGLIRSDLIPRTAYINIEHSDEVWKDYPSKYKNDFNILRAILAGGSGPTARDSDASLKYAENYLKKILKGAVENFPEIIELDGRPESQLLHDWMNHIRKMDKRISLSKEELDSEIAKSSVYFLDSFSDFLNKE